MPFITKEQTQRLIEAENYFWEHSDWKDNGETEKALWNIWSTVEELLGKKYAEDKKAKEYMRAKRAINKDYGRSKNAGSIK